MVVFEGCFAQQFWFLSRHGTRNPGTKDMNKMNSILPIFRDNILLNHKAGRGSLCKDDLNNLEKWKFRANLTDDKFLVREGYKELAGLGNRYQDRFTSLLTKPFINSSYIVS